MTFREPDEDGDVWHECRASFGDTVYYCEDVDDYDRAFGAQASTSRPSPAKTTGADASGVMPKSPSMLSLGSDHRMEPLALHRCGSSLIHPTQHRRLRALGAPRGARLRHEGSSSAVCRRVSRRAAYENEVAEGDRLITRLGSANCSELDNCGNTARPPSQGSLLAAPGQAAVEASPSSSREAWRSVFHRDLMLWPLLRHTGPPRRRPPRPHRLREAAPRPRRLARRQERHRLAREENSQNSLRCPFES